MLGYVYIDANMVEKQDSCINSVKHLPEFEEVSYTDIGIHIYNPLNVYLQ